MTITPDAPAGPRRSRTIALSLSPPADLAALGYPAGAYDRLTFDLALRIIHAEGRVLYGGHLRPDGVTVKILEQLAAAYARADAAPDKPVLNLLACSELARADLDMAELAHWLARRRRWIDVQLVCPEGPRSLIVMDEGAVPHFVLKGDAVTDFTARGALQDFAARTFVNAAEALTAMRTAAEKLADGRIVAGGKRGDLGVPGLGDQYSGAMPGIFEEIIGSLKAGKKCAILAAYGGAGREAAIALGLLADSEASPWQGDKQPGVEDGLAALRALAATLPGDDRKKMTEFATRDDGETLARDVVAWLNFPSKNG